MNDRSSPNDVTELLREVCNGQAAAVGALFEEVYPELRQRAHHQRQRWKGNPSLQTTALVNEVYLKLVDPAERSWESRSHFLAVSAQAMRHILIDNARRKTREKRGGDAQKLSLEELKERLGREITMTEDDAEAFFVLDAALRRLEDAHPRAARGVECRFFAGMTIEETAEALGVSTATVSRDWSLAKPWLYREMKNIRGHDAPSKNEISS